MNTTYAEPITVKVGRRTEVFTFTDGQARAMTKRWSTPRTRVAKALRKYRNGDQGAVFKDFGKFRPVLINTSTLPIKASRLVRILWGPGSWRP